MNCKKLKIGLDVDDVLASFMSKYCEYFDTKHHPSRLKDHIITKNVENILKFDESFWLNLPVKNTIDFVPELYCSKRVNPKKWSKQWLKNNGFPDRPFYQMIYQHGNKAQMIKGRVDVFIDDSLSNVIKCINSGLPALWLKTNKEVGDPEFTIYSLDYDTIQNLYYRIYA